MTYAEQRRHYREAAWDRGCTCPMLAPHVHLLDCPLYETPGGVPSNLHDHDVPRVTPEERREAEMIREELRAEERYWEDR